MAYLLALKVVGICIMNKIIKLIGSILKASKSNHMQQPQPQPQPVQQNLLIEPMSNEQTSFLFDEPVVKEKSCPNCKRSLPFTSFRTSSKHEDGLTKWCIECLSTPRDSTHSNKKKCPSCKKTRLKTSFYKNSKQPDGLTKWCKTCMDNSRK